MASPTALLAEDNLINQMMVSDLLEDMGMSVEIAGDGLQAVEMCKKHKYDLIFMDLEMPKLNGSEAAQEIRKRESYFTPIIALTAHDREGKIQGLRKAGFNGFLQKPVSHEDLEKLVHSFISPSHLTPKS